MDLRAGGGATDTGRTALDNKTSLLNTMPSHSSPRSRDYNPYNYSDSVGSFNKSALKEAMFDDDAEQFPDGKSSVLLTALGKRYMEGTVWVKTKNCYLIQVTCKNSNLGKLLAGFLRLSENLKSKTLA